MKTQKNAFDAMSGFSCGGSFAAADEPVLRLTFWQSADKKYSLRFLIRSCGTADDVMAAVAAWEAAERFPLCADFKTTIDCRIFITAPCASCNECLLFDADLRPFMPQR